MKNLNHLIIYLIFILLSCSKDEDAQLTPVIETGKMTKQLVVNNTNREYIIYVPENFTGTSSLPLLLSFHGLSSNMNFNYDYTNFDELAERENFIVVHPNGIDNRWTVSATNNPDIDFIEALLDQLENDYNIASNRIYSTGMSNGGNFSFTLACGLNDRIAAIASVTGLMLQMAICEFQKFPSIPVKVTINEYLEIAKEYSTPKSSIFINGILDKISKSGYDALTQSEKEFLFKQGKK
mgnify:CR=1 FL=1